MADYNDLTYFHLDGRYNGIVGDTGGAFGDAGPTPDFYNVNMDATIGLEIATTGPGGTAYKKAPELRLTTATPPRTLLLLPVKAQVESGVLRYPGAETGFDGVDLVAASPILGLTVDQTLLCRVTFGPTTIGGSSYQYDPVLFEVPTILLADYHPNVVQTITIEGSPTGGTWFVVYGSTPIGGQVRNATALAVQTALRGLAAIGPTGVTVAGPDGGPYVATFNTAVVPRPARFGVGDNLIGGDSPHVTVTDAFAMQTVDLTTVTRWAA